MEEQEGAPKFEVVFRPSVGPNIVRAWFDTALNPIIEFLETEIGLLGRRNWTYSFGARNLNLIQPIKPHFYNANLEQILQANAELNLGIEEHDKTVEKLRSAVVSIHDALVYNREFIALGESLLRPESLATMGIMEMDAIFGAYSEDDRLKIIAQYVVNGTGDLPPHYSTAKFWNHTRAAFSDIATRDGVDSYVKKAEVFAESLSAVGKSLLLDLKQLRQDLSYRHDVPILTSERSH